MELNDREADQTLSRRDALKRGAVAGTAVLFVAPAVHVIGLDRAHASSPSAPPITMTVPPATATTTTTKPKPVCLPIAVICCIFKLNNKYYGFKCDPKKGGWSPASSKDCAEFKSWESATKKKIVTSSLLGALLNRFCKIEIKNDCEWHIKLPLPSSCSYTECYGRTKPTYTGKKCGTKYNDHVRCQIPA